MNHSLPRTHNTPRNYAGMFTRTCELCHTLFTTRGPHGRFCCVSHRRTFASFAKTNLIRLNALLASRAARASTRPSVIGSDLMAKIASRRISRDRQQLIACRLHARRRAAQLRERLRTHSNSGLDCQPHLVQRARDGRCRLTPNPGPPLVVAAPCRHLGGPVAELTT